VEDLTPKNSPSLDPIRKPCPVCGGTSYTWGRTVGESPSQYVYFRADKGAWGDGKRMYARECNQCGNVQLFTRE
jgi:hypothetical protein